MLLRTGELVGRKLETLSLRMLCVSSDDDVVIELHL